MEENETQAREHGWVPEEEFRANPNNEGKKWRTAEDFMDRKSLFDKIDDQHREVRRLREGMTALQQHNQQIEQRTREKVIKELQSQKAEAAKEGDIAKVEEIRDQIEEVRAQPAAPVTQQPAVNPEFTQWMGDNPWYSTNTEMRRFADAYGVALAQEGKAPQDVLKEVSKQVKKVYPDQFRNPNKDSAPAVQSGSGRKSQSSSAELTEMQERIWKGLQRAGVPSSKDPTKKMTREEYIEQVNG